MNQHDFLIVGAGIFGVCTAIDLRKRGYRVALMNQGEIPDPLAASTDISKVVRMEYGSDAEYMRMAAECMEAWRKWNIVLGEELYHEVGYILLCAAPLESGNQPYEAESYHHLLELGWQPERIDTEEIAKRFPAWKPNVFHEAIFHAVGGFAESGNIVIALCAHAQKLGVEVFENQTVSRVLINNQRAEGVMTKGGDMLKGDHVIICAGNSTPYLVPDLMQYMKVTGHPVFHIKPSQPKLFASRKFPVFAADISNSGWYGFPLHPKEKVVKIANHGVGVELHPQNDKRVVTQEDLDHLQVFLRSAIPALADDPVVFTRRCCYTDTLDGHFWIDRHPEIDNLTIGSGGSGHGFKMGPAAGEMIAEKALGAEHKWSDRYDWRHLEGGTEQVEEARFLESRERRA